MQTAGTRSDPLGANPIFTSLDPQARAVLERRSTRRLYEPRALVLAEGDDPDHVYVLVKGSVRVFHASPSGLEVVVKVFKPPSVFGEMEVISDLPFLQSVDALEPSEILLIPREVFLELIETHHGATLALLRDVCARLCIASHNEKSLAFHDVRTRLANFLCCYAEFDGEQTPRGIRLRLRLTQDDMSTALGVTRRAVAKEMIRWQKMGLVTRERGHYVIRELSTLAGEASTLHLAVTYSIGRPVSTPTGPDPDPR